jgi:hypothetical protein
MKVLVGLLALALAGLASSAAAAPSDSVARAEAARRFDRGLQLFNEGDNAGALAEFKRAYALTRDPTVLFNTVVVYAAMNRPVEALGALETLLAAPGNLSAPRKARAETMRGELAARVSTLDVRSNVPGVISVDGIEVGRTPLSSPVPVSSGHRVVEVAAPGHTASRKAIDIAGGEAQSLAFELVPTASSVAHLKVVTALEGVMVAVDGQEMGKTPFAVTLALAPGRHQVMLRRAGYHTVTREVTLTDGDTGDVAADLEEDHAALSALGGLLALDDRQPGALVTVDGRDRGPYQAALLLPPGLHRLQVARAGYFPFDAPVAIETGKTTAVRVRLRPTPDTLDARHARVRAQKLRAWSTMGGGLLVAAAGGTFLLINQSAKSSADENLRQVEALYERGKDRQCDQDGNPANPPGCAVWLDEAQQRVDRVRGRDPWGWIAGGVGAAAAVVGVVLLAAVDDPTLPDGETTPVASRPRAIAIAPTVSAFPRGGAAGILVRF